MVADEADRLHQLRGLIGVHAGSRLIEKKKLADWNWSGIISWFLAIFMGLCMTAAPTGLGVPALVKLAGVVPTPIVGVIVAFVCNMVLYPLLNKRAAKG